MMSNCFQFDTLKLRIERSKQLNLFELCSSAGHLTERCLGNQNNLKYGCYRCQSKSHIASFCPDKFKEVEQVVNNMCLSLSNRIDNQQVLPTLTIGGFSENRLRRVRALLDTGSQRSYLSSNLVKDLFSNFNSFNTEKYEIRTFIGTESKQFKQICLGLKIDQGKNYTLPFLVDDSLKFQYDIQNLTSAIKNLKDK